MHASFSSTLSRPAASEAPHEVRLSGAIAGFAGGFAMMITGGIVAMLFGYESWLGPKEIAAIADRSPAGAQPGFVVGPLLLGLAIHFVVAALLGAIFDLVYHHILRLTTDFGLPVYSGLAYGLWLWVASYFVVLPALGVRLTETYAVPFLVQYVIYGVVTGLLYIWLSPEPYHER